MQHYNILGNTYISSYPHQVHFSVWYKLSKECKKKSSNTTADFLLTHQSRTVGTSLHESFFHHLLSVHHWSKTNNKPFYYRCIGSGNLCTFHNKLNSTTSNFNLHLKMKLLGATFAHASKCDDTFSLTCNVSSNDMASALQCLHVCSWINVCYVCLNCY